MTIDAQSVPSTLVPVEASPTERICQNCGAQVSGHYCGGCGQRLTTARLALGDILRELPGKVFNWERGLWLTFWALWCRPGSVCAEYVQGRRRTYVNPISYFLIGASLQLLSLYFSAPIIRQSLEQSIRDAKSNPGQAKVFERMDAQLGGDTAEAMANVYLSVIAQAYTYLALLAFACPLGVMLWLWHGRWKPSYHFAEVMVFSLFVIGQGLIVTALATPILGRIHLGLQMVVAQGFYLVFACWAHHGFFQSTWLARAGTGLAMLVAMLGFFISITVLFGLSWVAYLLWFSIAGPAN